MSASELLAQYGVTFQQAREFIHNNLNSPSIIYSTAAQYGITFEMLGELYADGVSDIDVKNYFASQGYPTASDTPIVASTPDEPDDVVVNDIDLTLDSVLNLSDEEIQNSDWDSLITDYQTALANIDWSAWNTTLESTLANFDWEAWAAELQEYANALASDGSWIAQLESAFNNTNFDDLFDDSAWEDVSSNLDDIDWSSYTAYLQQFGMTAEEASSLIEQSIGSIDWDQIEQQLNNFDWTAYSELLANFDWSGYADLFANLDWTEYMQSMENLYSNLDYSALADMSSLIGVPSNEMTHQDTIA